MAGLHFRTQYDAQVSKDGIKFTDKSRTQQEFKDECDINNIMKIYAATGVIEHTADFQPVFADVRDYQGDLSSVYSIIDRANEAFMALPSGLREELGHDPRNLSSYITNPANKQKCIDYGIFNKPDEETKPNIVTPDPT